MQVNFRTNNFTPNFKAVNKDYFEQANQIVNDNNLKLDKFICKIQRLAFDTDKISRKDAIDTLEAMRKLDMSERSKNNLEIAINGLYIMKDVRLVRRLD